MTKDTWAIIATMCAGGSIICALLGIAISQNSQLNRRISLVNARLADLDGDRLGVDVLGHPERPATGR